MTFGKLSIFDAFFNLQYFSYTVVLFGQNTVISQRVSAFLFMMLIPLIYLELLNFNLGNRSRPIPAQEPGPAHPPCQLPAYFENFVL